MSVVESTEESSLIIGDLDLDAVDDDELFKLLKENGIEVGPIVASTRPFYKKKLALVLRGENDMNGTNGTNGGEFSDTEPETEPEDDQPSGVTTPQVSLFFLSSPYFSRICVGLYYPDTCQNIDPDPEHWFYSNLTED